MKEYIVYFPKQIPVSANSEKEAQDKATKLLNKLIEEEGAIVKEDSTTQK